MAAGTAVITAALHRWRRDAWYGCHSNSSRQAGLISPDRPGFQQHHGLALVYARESYSPLKAAERVRFPYALPYETTFLMHIAATINISLCAQMKSCPHSWS
jgi:hypothetical protein